MPTFYTSVIDPPMRYRIRQKFGNRCAYCGIKLHQLTVDHVISIRNFNHTIITATTVPDFLRHLTLADRNHIDNLFPACHECNTSKGHKDLETFRNHLTGLINKPFDELPAWALFVKRYKKLLRPDNTLVFYFETRQKHTN